MKILFKFLKYRKPYRYGKLKQFSHKKSYRFIDFNRTTFSNNINIVKSSIYDPNRSCFILLAIFPNNVLSFFLQTIKLPNRLSNLKNFFKNKHEFGHSMFLANTVPGSYVNQTHHIARSAGTFNIVLKQKSKNKSLIFVKLKSGSVISINKNTTCITGKLSNEGHFLRDQKKAGTTRHRLGVVHIQELLLKISRPSDGRAN